MNRATKLLGLTLLIGMANLAMSQPPCPTADLVHIQPQSPTTSDTITLSLHASGSGGGAVQVDWEFVEQVANRIVYNTFVHQGAFGAPPNATTLGSLAAGAYELAISPYILMGEEPNLACPPLSVAFTVAGAPSAAVPAPLFSLPGLLLLMGLFGLLGWTALRPR